MKGRKRRGRLVAVGLLLPALVVLLGGGALAQNGGAPFGRDIVVPAGTTSSEAVTIGGSVRVEGKVTGSAVAIGGDVYVSGEVGEDVVALGGTVVLAPGAVVHGDAVAIGGGVERAEALRCRAPGRK